MKPAVILGGSPFISEVDVQKLCDKYTTIAINRIAADYHCDYVFMWDWYLEGLIEPVQRFFKHCFRQENGIKYVSRTMDKPLLKKEYHEGYLVLGFKYFTVSCAINWAILAGFTELYLVGIDHVESEQAFKHYNPNWDGPGSITPEAHRAVKKFIYAANSTIPIYQCNPHVKDQWDLPFKPIEELY